MNRLVLVSLVLMVQISMAPIAFCQDDPNVQPDILFREVVDELLEILKTDEEVQGGNVGRIYEIMEEKVAPHFDFARMTRLSIGRPWRDATEAQRESLTKEFHTMLMRAYAAGFKQYKAIVVETKAMPRVPIDQKEVSVSSIVRLPGGAPPISIDYDLTRKNGQWQTYDVRIDGVSLVINYRNIFAQEIQKAGIDGLIQSLREKNSAPLE